VRTGDAEAIAEIYAPFVLGTPTSFEIEPPDMEEVRGQILRYTGEGYPWLVAEDGDGRVVGYAYSSPHRVRYCYRWSVDVSAYIAEGFRNMGIGKALYGRLIEELRDAGFWNAYAGITLPNAASVGLHESVGFVPVGVYQRVGYKMGAWHDVGWWQLALRPGFDAPA